MCVFETACASVLETVCVMVCVGDCVQCVNVRDGVLCVCVGDCVCLCVLSVCVLETVC